MVMNRRFEGDGKPPFLGIRHLQCFLLFWGIAFAYGMRVNLSLAIVAMTDKKSTNQDFAEYAWSEKVKSLILSSFFWGYVTTQLLGGFLARKFGGKVSILVGILMCSVLALLTPLCARVGGWQLVVGLRVLQGMCQGMLFPTTHTLLAKWAPEEERAALGAYCYAGSQLGTVAMFAASGFIASSSIGWPAIFYISGGLGAFWVFAWYLWGASSPEDYKAISLAEKDLIESSLAKGKETTQIPTDSLHTPWGKILTSPAFLALTATHCGFNWGFWMVLTEIPSYMKNILGFNIKSNALLTALPYLVMFILGFVFTGIAGWMQKRKCLSLVQSRKFFNSISSCVPAIALICLGYVDSNHTQAAIILLIIAVGISAAMNMGFQVNHIDLSPNFAGILLGFTNTMATIMSILAPLTVGFVVTDEKNPLQWRIIFFIAAGIYFISNLLFVIFGKANVQPWNEPRSGEYELKISSNSNKA